VAKQLDVSRWHLAWRWASIQATVYTVPLPKKGAEPPISGPFLLWPDGWIYQDTTWYGSRPQPRRHCVRWEPSSPSPKGAKLPQFSANVRCSQTAGWTKMPLGMDVGLGPGDFVFGGDPAPSQKRRHSPHPLFGPFVPCLLWPNGWMDQDSTWYAGKSRPRRRCIRWGSQFPPPLKKGHIPPVFGPCLLWPNGWMDSDATWNGK